MSGLVQSASPSAQPAALPQGAATPGQAGGQRGPERAPGEEMGSGAGMGASEKANNPLSPLCPPPTHRRLCPAPSHSPCKYRAHRREEPLRGVEAEDGHAVCPLQAELRDQGRQARSAGPEGGLSFPARPPSGTAGTTLPGHPVGECPGALAAPPGTFPGSQALCPAQQAAQPDSNVITNENQVLSGWHVGRAQRVPAGQYKGMVLQAF